MSADRDLGEVELFIRLDATGGARVVTQCTECTQDPGRGGDAACQDRSASIEAQLSATVVDLATIVHRRLRSRVDAINALVRAQSIDADEAVARIDELTRISAELEAVIRLGQARVVDDQRRGDDNRGAGSLAKINTSDPRTSGVRP